MIHLPGISDDIKEKIVEQMKRPEGTYSFKGKYDRLWDESKEKGILLQIITGKIVFILERDENFNINFYMASPGTGTRIATVDAKPLKGISPLQFFLTWSPENIGLHIGALEGEPIFLTGTSRKADFDLLVGENGSIYTVGDSNVEVLDFRVMIGGKSALNPTAIQIWKRTMKAIEILLSGTSKEGYIFETVVSNMIIVILTTGFEAYTQNRFIELTGEGFTPNYDELEKKFFSTWQRKERVMDIIKSEAKSENKTLAEKLLEYRIIDFGNYDDCKNAYNKGYGIRFGIDLDVSNQILEKIREHIQYRHKIVHTSPLIGMLNQDKVPPDEPVFANKKTVEKVINIFNVFIEKLHKATLDIRP
ncbi:MAG: hypothetical protein NWE89_04665 [Candidatus Bathyarchaeota archaeon]|nr:hypothetical protein [Candidatus Bathyarchaeota archaeon]